MKTLSDPEVECLKLKKEINENHRLAQKAAGDAVERALLTGELLQRWKELLPHGRFESFTETHFDGSLSTARSYMLAAKRLGELPKRQRSGVLAQESSISGLLEALKPSPSDTSRKGAAPASVTSDSEPDDSISAKGKPGGERRPSSTPTPVSPGPASGEAADSKDLGKCPNCGGKNWTQDEFGASCAKCKQPHGEALGDADETGQASKKELAKTQRLKWIKTIQADIRAADDMNYLARKPREHDEAIRLLKSVLHIAQEWPT